MLTAFQIGRLLVDESDQGEKDVLNTQQQLGELQRNKVIPMGSLPSYFAGRAVYWFHLVDSEYYIGSCREWATIGSDQLKEWQQQFGEQLDD